MQLIKLTRALGAHAGEEIWINPELIIMAERTSKTEQVTANRKESMPFTVIHLNVKVDAKQFVRETPDEINKFLAELRPQVTLKL